MDWKDGRRDTAIIEAHNDPDLMTGLEGSDCWDDPAVWDSLEHLGRLEEMDLLDEFFLTEGPSSGVLLDDEDILGPAAPPEQVCPLSRCAWSREGICVFCLRDWCPNQSVREKARRQA